MKIKFKIADKVFTTDILYSHTKEFFKDYLYEGKEDETLISVSKEDIKKEKNGLAKPVSEEHCELLALHRKITESLISSNVILLHASAIGFLDKGIIFTAPSGVGKSTHAEKWHRLFGAEYINDDKPYISVNEQITIFGSPFMGDHMRGNNTSYPLSAICFIKRSQENKIEKSEKNKVFDLLISQTYFPKSEKNLCLTLNLVTNIANSVPSYIVHCTKDDASAIVAKEELSKLLNIQQ